MEIVVIDQFRNNRQDLFLSNKVYAHESESQAKVLVNLHDEFSVFNHKALAFLDLRTHCLSGAVDQMCRLNLNVMSRGHRYNLLSNRPPEVVDRTSEGIHK